MGEPNENDQLHRLVVGALRATIEAHGPITSQLIGSAAKRITHAIRAAEKATSYRWCEAHHSVVWTDGLSCHATAIEGGIQPPVPCVISGSVLVAPDPKGEHSG